MGTQQQEERNRKNIMDKIWDEVKKINWAEINEQCDKNFLIGLVGNTAQIQEMVKWLGSFDYSLAIERKAGVKEEQLKIDKSIKEHIVKINIAKEVDEKLIKNLNFCLVDESSIDFAKKNNVKYFLFQNNDKELAPRILSNHNEINFALSNNFSVFRCPFSNSVINSTSIQNASWAVVTASPNLVPGPHQVVTAPVEAISDFTVLTANEVKMLFELVGLTGHRVNPLTCLFEFGVILLFANLAKAVATNIGGKVPAGAGLVTKGSVSYAFTKAIGEALFFYITTGEKVGKEFFEKRIKELVEQSKEIIENMIAKIKGNKGSK